MLLASNLSEETFGGSIFINNTSYSGVDIKVVVNIYDYGRSTKDRLKEIGYQVDHAAIEVQKLESENLVIEAKLFTKKPGTVEYSNLSKKRLNNISEIDRLNKFVENSVDLIKEIQAGSSKSSSKVLAEIQTLSVSTHRDKQAVRSCGTVYPRAFTRGPREIAGSMIFTVFNEHVLYEFLDAHASDFDAEAFTSALIDQIPPVDITIAFANEYGSVSRMGILGVEFVNEGQTMSVEDLLTENVVQYVARDIDPMRSVAQRKLDENSIMVSQFQPLRASDLLLEEDYQQFTEDISPFNRFSRRRNPFL